VSDAAEQELASLDSIGASERRRALLVVNPYATTVSARRRDVVVSALASRYELEAVETRARGDATAISAEAAEGDFDVVIAFGGDGTVNEVANGLAGTATPLIPLPGGSANVYCKLLGIPAEIVDATAHVLGLADRWQPRAVDLGLVAGRHYTFSAGIGIDASVVARVDARPDLKRRFGANFFLAGALWTFGRHYLRRPPRMLVAVEDRSFTGVTTVVQNAEHYTYFNAHAIDLADGATLDSGTLAGIVLLRGSLLDLPSLTARAVSGTGRVGRHRRVASFSTATAVSVSSSDGRALPLQIDGDYIGEFAEARFTISPGALQVIA
jgi:diacylglycerol kinase family enzyme